uniref:Bestrophin homolog n=1 Tax=Rodentolepis nana TaxID=102285 RepID=A0A0R3TVP6_RODNA
LVWIDLFLYLAVYYIISLIYRFALPETQKSHHNFKSDQVRSITPLILCRNFEDVVRFCEAMKGNIPVSFLLGFFVSGVIGRWYNMYMYIPWMNHIAYSTMSYVNCADKSVSKEIRLSLMRYMNLSWILLMRRISDQIADRFKQLDEDSDCEQEYCCKGYSKCCNRKKKMHHIMQHPWSSSQVSVTTESLLFLNSYSHFCLTGDLVLIVVALPSEVVIIAVYSYFGCELLASQFLEVPKVEGEAVVDFFVPIFSIFYFLFLMGWLKVSQIVDQPVVISGFSMLYQIVALCVMNPFGDDDEDFETSDILDYNLDVSYRTVLMDESTYPEQLKAPTFEIKTMKGAENDNLRDFVKSTHKEMDKIDTNQDDNGLVNLEIKHSCCKCFPKRTHKKEEESKFCFILEVESSPLKLILNHKQKKEHPEPVDV